MNVNSGETLNTLMLIDDIHISEYQFNGNVILPLSYALVSNKYTTYNYSFIILYILIY